MGTLNVQAKVEDPIDVDSKLYGTEITEEEIIYDASLGIDRLREVYEQNNLVRGPIHSIEQERKYKKYFKRVSWILRGSTWSLSVNFNWSNGIYGNREDSWNILLRFHNNDYRWRDARKYNPSTYTSMYNQYICHYDLIKGIKNPYNLEPYLKDKGYWGFIASRCNK